MTTLTIEIKSTKNYRLIKDLAIGLGEKILEEKSASKPKSVEKSLREIKDGKIHRAASVDDLFEKILK